MRGEKISGTYKHAVNLASGKYAIIENAKEFVLVPWQPNFEDMRGKLIAGTAGLSRTWELSKSRQLGPGI